MNLITETDSYKLGHWQQYPKGTTGVYSYLEARNGGQFDQSVFFGLQPILESLQKPISLNDIAQARDLAKWHFGREGMFNYAGWMHIFMDCGGRLPVRIKAVPEGTVMPVGNVLMTVENTDPAAYWLTNALESILMHVWYPMTVASLSYSVKQMLKDYLRRSGAPENGLRFMLHDFGYRGATTSDAAAIGGLAHLVNFVGTDTVPALLLAMEMYDANEAVGYSIPASEHSVMTALGRAGEHDQLMNMLDVYPEGIVSVVADSYNYYDFVGALGNVGQLFYSKIMARNGKVVVRPDSVTLEHPTPESLIVWTLEKLWHDFGGTTNQKGFRVLDPHVGVIWGDGIDPKGIEGILGAALLHGFSAENLVFGMGGGLLQKVNRDTMRVAFKSSAQKRNGQWYDVYKEPLDITKRSKAGRLKLIQTPEGNWSTITQNSNEFYGGEIDRLETVFLDGKPFFEQKFNEIRARAGF